MFFSNKNIIFFKFQHIFKDYEISLIEKDTLYLSTHNVKISLFFYPYPLLYPLRNIDGVCVADEKDILAMKVSAIVQRGSKRDFIDVYFLMRQYSLKAKDVVEMFLKKYGDNINRMIIYKAMVYFDDAEREPRPKMIKQVEWESVKEFFYNRIL